MISDDDFGCEMVLCSYFCQCIFYIGLSVSLSLSLGLSLSFSLSIKYICEWCSFLRNAIVKSFRINFTLLRTSAEDYMEFCVCDNDNDNDIVSYSIFLWLLWLSNVRNTLGFFWICFQMKSAHFVVVFLYFSILIHSFFIITVIALQPVIFSHQACRTTFSSDTRGVCVCVWVFLLLKQQFKHDTPIWTKHTEHYMNFMRFEAPFCVLFNVFNYFQNTGTNNRFELEAIWLVAHITKESLPLEGSCNGSLD